jgi:tetratricopeptide (TPR) repeat protein
MRHMFPRFTRAGALTASVAALALAPAVVQAQPGGVAAACNIDPNDPKDLALISIKLQGARAQQDPTARKTALQAIIRDLETKPERFAKNPVGYNYTISQVLSALAVEPTIGTMPTRAALGVPGTPTDTYDVIARLDEAFKAIATGAPGCAAEAEQLRQNDVWLALTRRSLDASNNNQLDTADYYAAQSMRLSTASPYPHYVMGNVANARGNKKGAVAHWKQVVSTAGTDSTYKDIRNSSMYFVGATQLELAATLAGAEQKAAAAEAAASFKTLMDATGETADTPSIMQSMADALKLAGDSASIPTVYAALLASPDKFNDFTHTMGGVIATQANRLDDAIKMFEAAVQKNPTARDALRNLAATYYAKESFKAMFEPSAKLVAIDPNNFDGWMMFAYGYQGLMQAEKVAATKKQYTDSLVKYRTLAEGLPAKAEIVNFQRGSANATLVMSLEQQAAAPGTYSVTVDFLDASGAVVGSDTQSIGPIEKGKSAQGTFKANGAGIVGYRYKPIK